MDTTLASLRREAKVERLPKAGDQWSPLHHKLPFVPPQFTFRAVIMHFQKNFMVIIDFSIDIWYNIHATQIAYVPVVKGKILW